MFSRSISLKMWLVFLLATLTLTAGCDSSTPPEKPWDQKFNDEVSDIDVMLGDPQGPPAFEFHINEDSPHFSVILCTGPSDDTRVKEDTWNVFFNNVRQYGPADSYKLDFTELHTSDDRSLTRVMMFVNLLKGADQAVAVDVAKKVATVMRESSPCK